VTNTATVTGSGPEGQPVSATATDTVTISQSPGINVEKLVSIDNGTNWWFLSQPGDVDDNATFIHNATGIPLVDLHSGTPTPFGGTPLKFEVVVTNTGNVTDTNVSVSDLGDTSGLAGSFTFGGSSSIPTLLPGVSHSVVSDFITTTALPFGMHTDTATVTASSPAGPVTDTDSVAYNVMLQETTPGLTIGYWYNHQTGGVKGAGWNTDAYVTVNGVATKGVLLGDSLGTTWKGHTTAATALSAVPAGMLFVPDAAATTLINSSQSANDTRQIFISQALAAQLNIDNGDVDPGVLGKVSSGDNIVGSDLISEAVKWLDPNLFPSGSTFGQSPFIYPDKSSGNVDWNYNGVSNTASSGAIPGVDYNTTTNAFTFMGLNSAGPLGTANPADAVSSPATSTLTSSSQAWNTPVDTGVPTLTTGDFFITGQQLKNALQAFNQNNLQTSSQFGSVSWLGAGVQPNTAQGMYTVLHNNGIL
jgi:uncharacterized repeat protein (TIGR01451 family)